MATTQTFTLSDDQVEFLADHLIAYRTLRAVYADNESPVMKSFWKTLMGNWYSIFEPEEELLYPGISFIDLEPHQLWQVLEAGQRRKRYIQQWFRGREVVLPRYLRRQCAPRRIDESAVYMRLYSHKVREAADVFFASRPDNLSARRRHRLLHLMAADMLECESAVVKAVVRREAEYLVMICMAEN